MKDWIAAVGACTAYIERGSSWENGYVERFNSRLRDELLNGEIFSTLREAQIIIESWRQHYNRVRPHSSLGYRPPTPEVVPWPASPAVESTVVAVIAAALLAATEPSHLSLRRPSTCRKWVVSQFGISDPLTVACPTRRMMGRAASRRRLP